MLGGIFLTMCLAATCSAQFQKQKQCTKLPINELQAINTIIEDFLKNGKTDADTAIAEINSRKNDPKPDECSDLVLQIRQNAVEIIKKNVELKQQQDQSRVKELEKEIQMRAVEIKKVLTDLEEEEARLRKKLELLKKQGDESTFVKAVYYVILNEVSQGLETFQQLKDPSKAPALVYKAYRIGSIGAIMDFIGRVEPDQIPKSVQAVYEQIMLFDDAQNPLVYLVDYHVRILNSKKLIDDSLKEKIQTGLRSGVIEKMKELGRLLASRSARAIEDYEKLHPGFWDYYLEMIIENGMEPTRWAGHNILDITANLSEDIQARAIVAMYQETKRGNQDYANMLSLPPRIAYMVTKLLNKSQFQSLPDSLKIKVQKVKEELLEKRLMSNLEGPRRFSWPMANGKRSMLAVTTKREGGTFVFFDNPDKKHEEWMPAVIDWEITSRDNGRNFLIAAKGLEQKFLTVDRENNIKVVSEPEEGSYWWLLDYPHNGRFAPRKDFYSGDNLVVTLFNNGFYKRLLLPGDESPRPPSDILRTVSVEGRRELGYDVTGYSLRNEHYWELLPSPSD